MSARSQPSADAGTHIPRSPQRPRLLDLFCCAGGAARGYRQAGFWVQGVDIEPQPRYAGDAFGEADVRYLRPAWIAANFDAVHASPPCQRFSNAQRLRGYDHPDLVAPIRALLRATGLPYIIENVEGAPLIDPVMLCGSMFPGLRVYRHRLFECSFPAVAPQHGAHLAPLRKMGRPPAVGDFMHVVGNFSGVAQAREAMGIDWMTRNELREAIPPAYTEFLGRQLLAAVEARRLAA